MYCLSFGSVEPRRSLGCPDWSRGKPITAQAPAALDYRLLGPLTTTEPHVFGSGPCQDGTVLTLAGLGLDLARFIITRGNDGPPPAWINDFD